MPYSKFPRSRFHNLTLSARGALIGFARRSVNSNSTPYRKRCFTRLLPSAHTARPSRWLLSTAAPGSRRAGHAVCLGLGWHGRKRNKRNRNTKPDASGKPRGFRFARRTAFGVSRHCRKRCFIRLLPSAHTARPSRRLLSTAAPGSRRAGHAVCLGLWWLGQLFGFRSSASFASPNILVSKRCDSLTPLCLSDFRSSMHQGNSSFRGIRIPAPQARSTVLQNSSRTSVFNRNDA